jgi:hypothetical protein
MLEHVSDCGLFQNNYRPEYLCIKFFLFLKVPHKMRADTGFIDNLDEKNRSFLAVFKYQPSYPRYNKIKLKYIHE